MKDSIANGRKPTKSGTRTNVTSAALHKLADTFTAAAMLYDAVNSPLDFMQALPCEGDSNTHYTRGNNTYNAYNKWIAIPTDNGEIRVTFSYNDARQFTVDFREWQDR